MSNETKGPQPPAEAQADWEAAPPGATHYQPHQDAYYKRVSASEWYVWSREDDRGLMRWLLSPSTSDSAEWVVRPSEAQPVGGGDVVPVAWRYRHPDGEGGWHGWIYRAGKPTKRYANSEYQPLYTAPPSAPVGVSAEDRLVLMRLRDALPDVGLNGWIRGVEVVDRILAPQPAADGGFTAADMMDARQEGRKEAQQPAAVDGVQRWADTDEPVDGDERPTCDTPPAPGA